MITTVLALVVALAQDGKATPAHVPLVLTVTNPGKTAARFCVYSTPFEDMGSGFMDITDADGRVVRYAGMMVKRSPPTDADYRTIEPGETMKARFDLHDGYTLGKGRYTLRFAGSAMSVLPASRMITIDVR